MVEDLERVTGDWQVEVEIYRTYVRKTPRTLTNCIDFLLTQPRFKDVKIAEISKVAKETLANHHHSIQLITDSSINKAFLGNPRFQNDGIIIQDRVIPIIDYFGNFSERKKIKQVIQDFIDITHKFWNYELFEMSFNFTINNGIDNLGNVMYLDVGEFTNDRELAQTKIVSQKWLNSFSFRRHLPPWLEDFYREKAENAFTLSVFEKEWGK